MSNWIWISAFFSLFVYHIEKEGSIREQQPNPFNWNYWVCAIDSFVRLNNNDNNQSNKNRFDLHVFVKRNSKFILHPSLLALFFRLYYWICSSFAQHLLSHRRRGEKKTFQIVENSTLSKVTRLFQSFISFICALASFSCRWKTLCQLFILFYYYYHYYYYVLGVFNKIYDTRILCAIFVTETVLHIDVFALERQRNECAPW